MIEKFKIIFDILFRNGKYLKATKDLYVKDNLYIKERIVHPLSFYGRTIVAKEQSENMPDNVIFQQALLEIFKSEEILKHVDSKKYAIQDEEYFLRGKERIAYDVKLKIITTSSK